MHNRFPNLKVNICGIGKNDPDQFKKDKKFTYRSFSIG